MVGARGEAAIYFRGLPWLTRDGVKEVTVTKEGVMSGLDDCVYCGSHRNG